MFSERVGEREGGRECRGGDLHPAKKVIRQTDKQEGRQEGKQSNRQTVRQKARHRNGAHTYLF